MQKQIESLHQKNNLPWDEQQNLVAVLGAKGSGKTLFITALLSSIVDGKVKNLTGTVSEKTHEFLKQNLLPMRQEHRWPNPTRGWVDLTLSLRRETPKGLWQNHKVTFKDIQGSDFETNSPQLIQQMEKAKAYFFIVSPKHLLTEEELIKAAGENAYLESVIPDEERFARQINWNYAQAIEKISETKGYQQDSSKKVTLRPITVIFTRKDDYPNLDVELLKQRFAGTFKWFQSHAKYVEYFFISSVGETIAPLPEEDEKAKQFFQQQYGKKVNLKLPAKKSPPPEIHPEGVVEPLLFTLNCFERERVSRREKRLKIASWTSATVAVLFCLLWIGAWGYEYYQFRQIREHEGQELQNYIDNNPKQVISIYQKIQAYLRTYGASHRMGQVLLGTKKRIFPDVQKTWFNEVSERANEADQDNLDVAEYQKAAYEIQAYLKSEFPDGKEYLREILSRIEKRKALARLFEQVSNSQTHGDYRHALSLIERYLKNNDFQKSLVIEKRKKLKELYSQHLYQKKMEEIVNLQQSENLDNAIISLEKFLQQEKEHLRAEEIHKVQSQLWQFRTTQALSKSKEAFQNRNYKRAYFLLENTIRMPLLPQEYQSRLQERLDEYKKEEYHEELQFCKQLPGKESLEGFYQFQEQYSQHPEYNSEQILEEICFSLASLANSTKEQGNREEILFLFSQEEQRFPDLVHKTEYWNILLPLIQARLNEVIDQQDYEAGWNLLKSYEIKLAGQLHLKKFQERIDEWADKLAQSELEHKWQHILRQKDELAVEYLENFRNYANRPHFSELYQRSYQEKVEEKRLQLCVEQYENALATNNFAEARLVLEQYQANGDAKYASRIQEMKENIDRQEIRFLWQPYLAKINDNFLSTSQKLEVAKQFKRNYRERPGYKFLEEDVELRIRMLTEKLKEERRSQLTRKIARAFEDKTALVKAQEQLESYKKNYAADPEISNFQSQIQQAQLHWGQKELQRVENIFDPAKKYEAYQSFIRKYSSKGFLYENIIKKAKELSEQTATEWDKREFQKADALWKEFRYRANEFSPEDGRQRLREIMGGYQDYLKHWGPKKHFEQQAKEQIFLLKKLLNGAYYDVELVKGHFAKNYWMMNPSVEVVLVVGKISYPFRVIPNQQQVKWEETKKISWKAYDPVQLLVRDRDKSQNNLLMSFHKTTFFSLLELCSKVAFDEQMVPEHQLSNLNNEITLALQGTSVPQINSWYGLESNPNGER